MRPRKNIKYEEPESEQSCDDSDDDPILTSTKMEGSYYYQKTFPNPNMEQHPVNRERERERERERATYMHRWVHCNQ